MKMQINDHTNMLRLNDDIIWYINGFLQLCDYVKLMVGNKVINNRIKRIPHI